MKILFWLCAAIFVGYIAVLALLYFFQERLIFFPSKLEADYKFSFSAPFEETFLDADGTRINGLRFFAKNGEFYAHARNDGDAKTSDEKDRAEQSRNGRNDKNSQDEGVKNRATRGAALFFHGNAGNLQGWGAYADYFTDLGLDFYVFDYRGYGKSGGEIRSQERLYADADAMMRRVLEDYDAELVTVAGYSLGSGLAARTAEKWGAKKLVLIAPYFSLEDLAREKTPFVPKFLIKYKIPTFEFVRDFDGPITIFHGRRDELIGVDNSRRLLKFLKPGDKIYELDASHNDILGKDEMWEILREKLGERLEL